ncbi:MAG: tetratricopeptide repeat protein [Kiritimatiellae bacterium]|nr:tetratricopeptide repeat protein [Kiritimatiellia bacterium]
MNTVRATPLLALCLCLLAAGCGRRTPDRLLQAAVRDLEAGRPAAAAGKLQEALSALPAEPSADPAAAALAGDLWNRLGLARLALGQTNEAAAAFASAIEAAPSAYEPLCNAGSLALERGDTTAGVRLLRQATDLVPTDTRALLLIGDHMTRIGRLDQAKRVYFEARKRDPRCAAAAVGLGRAAMLEGHLPQAENHFMAALEMQKDYPPALYNLGVLHSTADGLTDQAAGYFRQYLAVAPNGPRAAAATARLGGETIPQDSFRPPVAAPSPDRQAGLQWHQAQEALARGDREAAALCALRALEAARNGNNPSQRAEIVNRALDNFPDNPSILLEAAEYHLSASPSRPSDALQILSRARSLDPDNPLVLLNLSRAAAALDECDTAVISLRRLVELEPDNPDARWELATLYGDPLGMTSKAIAVYREFEHRFPSDPRASQVPALIAALEADAP